MRTSMLPERNVWLIGGMVLVFLVGVAFCSAVVTSPAPAHDWYSDLTIQRPGQAPFKCCGGRDCAPYDYVRTEGGLYYEAIMPNGDHLPIPPDTILPQGPEVPDDVIHVCCEGGHCRDQRSRVRCTIIPGFGA